MNKTELKNFAIQSRRQLIDQVKTKALMYGIDEKLDLEIQEQFGQLMINDKPYPLYMKTAFNSLKNQLKQKGYEQLVEEVAYTWFNRIIAIRYMEVHDYLPEKVNVLSSSVGRVDPDILFDYETMDLPVKQEEIRELLHAGDTESAYRKLFIAQCNALNSILPFLFEQIQDYTELLLPDFLLDAESVIKVLVQNDELTNSFEEIEVIGWLYQYYIAEEKDRVFAQKSKYKKEEIPFATQLFTPKWIVQYMVQNSLGRYWTEAHREDEDLISNWEYFIKHEEEDFHEKIAPYVNKELRVEDIKLLDPAMGSGHILVYAFEVFHQIYEKCGYPEREIPRLIIENNLYGLDIDDRAYQLAAFAVVMKASSYSRRFLRSVEREGIQLNLASIQETNHISDSVIAYIAKEEEGELYNQVKAFFKQYENAKTYGSLINITERDITFIEEHLEHIQNNPVEDLLYAEQHEITKKVLPFLIQQTKIMRTEYDVVVMNPPYMGSRNMSNELSNFLKKYYTNSKSDLFAAFMEVNHYLKNKGFYSAINQQSWMFLNSFVRFRESLFKNNSLDSMLHLGPRAFEDINGEVVQSTVFVFRKYKIDNYNGKYFRLVEIKTPNAKRETFLKEKHCSKSSLFFEFNQEKVSIFPNNILGYWIPEEIVSVFKKGTSLNELAQPREGIHTGNTEKYVRFWYEIDEVKFSNNEKSYETIDLNNKKWIAYNKGGSFKKWYGNNLNVIAFDKKTRDEMSLLKAHVRPSQELYFRKGITWNLISTNNFGVRCYPEGMLFDVSSHSLFCDNNDYHYFAGLLNSKLIKEILQLLNPTMNFSSGVIGKIPIIKPEPLIKNEIAEIVKNNIEICKKDWDEQEISWDFKTHPLIGLDNTLSNAYMKYELYKKHQFANIKNNEVQINELINKIYNVTLDNEIEQKDITTNIPSKSNAAKSLLSYFIGYLFGRFPLKNIKNRESIITITDKLYFNKDIILELRKFLDVTFSQNAVDENMQWLAEALEMKNGEGAEDRLRRYFLDEFFSDHCKMYQKCPIYWLVDSGKQKGLRTLIYMHRYQPDTMATIRFEHLQEIQAKYQNEITDLENRLVNPNLSASEKKKLTAEKTSFEKKMDELREFDKRLAEIANEEIEINLDDGVKMNYEKFYRGGKGVLAKIK
ncbi:BREX-1 system adenine-specific DNA-methyltransferase PglX [Heyndrickxia oleronia]|uniref:BREX-1 system adenine-specific DNA-methyltransferase PglX n=1 Tax=Heyndrickxia oleronia TaxID=38875 RepID=UPI002040449D|nr:BREX-1 system adenine-specific DNA-methyltransferase PglX [Heyndrickxia oleronia]